MVPLCFANTGEIVKINEIMGGETFTKRLMEMGFNKGVEVKVVKNTSGPLIVAIGGSRVVIARGMALKVMVNKN